MGRLHALTITNMYSAKHYINNITKLLHKLETNNNYNRKYLLSIVKKFLSKKPNLYNLSSQEMYRKTSICLESTSAKTDTHTHTHTHTHTPKQYI